MEEKKGKTPEAWEVAAQVEVAVAEENDEEGEWRGCWELSAVRRLRTHGPSQCVANLNQWKIEAQRGV